MSKETCGPAFPSHGSMGEVSHEGMTLRDYLAAKAMQGVLSNPDMLYENNHLAEHAYSIADAMLEARNK